MMDLRPTIYMFALIAARARGAADDAEAKDYVAKHPESSHRDGGDNLAIASLAPAVQKFKGASLVNFAHQPPRRFDPARPTISMKTLRGSARNASTIRNNSSTSIRRWPRS